MTDQPGNGPGPQGSINTAHVRYQLAKVLTTAANHSDAAVRARAEEKAAKWAAILLQALGRTVDYGSRTPLDGIPAWATLEVITGGFATGALLANGPLLAHEHALLARLPAPPPGAERASLNAHFLSDAGLAELQDALHSRRYQVDVPEESALLVVAWLVEQDHVDAARDLTATLSNYFGNLRFYPLPLATPPPIASGARVHVQDVGQTIEQLHAIQAHGRLLTQREAVQVWAPFYDRLVALFLETMVEQTPCQFFAADWMLRATALLQQFTALRARHKLCGKPERAKEHFAQLLAFLRRCYSGSVAFTPRELGRLRSILQRYTAKHGAPGSPLCEQQRARQIAEVSAPLHHEIAKLVATRLTQYPRNSGLDECEQVLVPTTDAEELSHGIAAQTLIPASIRTKVQRCVSDTVTALVERRVITSAESLASVLPQVVAELRALGIADPELRQVYAACYRAFRRRRSLLLLDLASQVRMEELPWVRAIEQFRKQATSESEVARQALQETTALTLAAFPQAILPNKLLQELRALLKSAALELPLVGELAADIFMGEFANSFLASARLAADLLERSPYAIYYDIDYARIRRMQPRPDTQVRGARIEKGPDPFAELCMERAGVRPGRPAANGMIIEQQQILTTQNLAALFLGLNLQPLLARQLQSMARQCWSWICSSQQMKVDRYHARLILVKNCAYAWRQMLFFLAVMPADERPQFVDWARQHLAAQSLSFRQRFAPAINGLVQACAGRTPDASERFLGWSVTEHWLLRGATGRD